MSWKSKQWQCFCILPRYESPPFLFDATQERTPPVEIKNLGNKKSNTPLNKSEQKLKTAQLVSAVADRLLHYKFNLVE
jgi:hypothetical protein